MHTAFSCIFIKRVFAGSTCTHACMHKLNVSKMKFSSTMMVVRATVVLLLALADTQAMVNSQDAAFEAAPATTAAVPFNCQADYRTMDPRFPKSLKQNPGMTNAHAPCVNPINGYFLVTYWQPHNFIYLFNTCRWITKKVNLPTGGRSYSCGCTFSGSKLFISATRNRKILQFTSEGVFEKVFATGHNFIYMATQGNQLYYVSIEFQKTIRMYDTTNGNLITHFQASGDTRGLAIDPQGYLRVAMYGKNVDIFTHDGHKVQQITYPQVSSLDGIAMDNETYSILVDRAAIEGAGPADH